MKTRTLISATASVAIATLALLGMVSPASAARTQVHPVRSMPQYPYGHPAGRQVPAVGARNAAAGYYWSGGGSGTYYTYNTSGGTVSVLANTPSTGIYQVSFNGLQGINDTGDVQVSSYDTTDTCPVLGWGELSGTEDVDVACYKPNGTLDTSPQEFDVAITNPHGKPAGVFDYAWVFADTHSANLTGLGQYNSSHKTDRVKHLGTGRYQVTFPGPKSSGVHGTAEVTPFGSGGGNCVLTGWTGTKTGEVVNVDCYSPAGSRENREFDVLYASSNNVLGLNRDVDANALFSGRSGITAPTEHYYSTRGAEAVAEQSYTGFYEVVLPGSGGEYRFLGGDVQVSAVGTHDDHCQVEDWDQDVIPAIDVECTNGAGDPASTHFVLQWMVPVELIV
ncbi:MAG TPA: hypothetical protein VMB74_08690 [Streptosporangiaceae bacterium]|nr:hypothetical protein [Streptosporangiaceae bacterium]